MHDASLSPLEAADAAFHELVAGAEPLTVDGSAIGHELPARALRLDELKPLLLSVATPYDARDAVVAELLRRARGGDERWVIGLIGVMMPGLRRVASRLTRGYPGDTECIDAAVLAGFVAAALRSPVAATGLAANLLWAAFRAGREIWVHEVSVSINRAPGEFPPVTARPAVGDHVDLVLARAVRDRAISADEAELIAATRLERVRMHDLARQLGATYHALQRRRHRAEARLVAYLFACDPGLSDFRRNRRLGECGHSGEQGCGQVARSTADTLAPALESERR
ncbi:MAG: hypothetical protein ACYDC4_11845 [Candidatus Dormibacteria bacterium]